jgi:HPr kinase/phosphorylase
MQIIGKMENSYLLEMPEAERTESIEHFMSTRPCAVILCHGVQLMPEMEAYAAQYDVNVFATEVDTSEFFAQLISTLANYLAPRETVHGVLVEVHGEGVLITGESGIGKSETALELIKRGHRLIADDAVEIKRISRNMLTGQAPDVIRYYLEIRGIGVVNVCYLYGIGAVKPIEHIDMVINLELWDDNKFYDRLGLETEFTTILDVKVPYMTIPVRPGRNLAVVIELAAMNNRHKKMGFNAAMELANAHDLAIDQGTLK